MSKPLLEPTWTSSRIKSRLMTLAQHRHFWRPVMKFALIGVSWSTMLRAVIYYVILTFTINKKVSFFNTLIPLLLLMGMEWAADTCDIFLTEMALDNLSQPADILLRIFLSTTMATTEISLWFIILHFYDKENKI